MLVLLLILLVVLVVPAGGAGSIDITGAVAGCWLQRCCSRCILYTFCPTTSRYIKTTRTDYWLQDHTLKTRFDKTTCLLLARLSKVLLEIGNNCCSTTSTTTS